MKADTQLQMDVREEWKWEPRVRDEEIGTEVRDGVVTLMGTVPDYAQRLRAERAVERVAGVRAVALERTPTTRGHRPDRAVTSLLPDADMAAVSGEPVAPC